MTTWNVELSDAFWGDRTFQSILTQHNLEEKRNNSQLAIKTREERDIAEKEKFLEDHNLSHHSSNTKPLPGANTASHLHFWFQHLSWTYCSKCKMLTTQRMLPNYFKRPVLKCTTKCNCNNIVYMHPTLQLIPEVLRGLSLNEMIALRPFNVHLGDYKRHQNGYRQKTNLFRLTWSQKTVLQKIGDLEKESSIERCTLAYQHLMHDSSSSYSHFVNLRDTALPENNRFNVYDFRQNIAIECALWPMLYPNKGFCETTLSGKHNRASTKIAFMVKVFSELTDYGTTFELLQFHYDMWIFKTVSGAITTARKQCCSPARSLEAKTFSAEFWKWQHHCLIDAVRQFGFPNLFITISPSEWSFPLPPWLLKLQQATGSGPTDLPAFETIHVVNCLEQLVRGYLCGSNDQKWSSHLFSYNRKAGINNVTNYFYRFEFQKRGTVHIHLLVWLKNAAQTGLQHVRGDIPWTNPDAAYLTYKLQKSDKGSLTIHDGDTTVETNDGVQSIKIHHPADAFAHNLRGYISTVLPALQCRMDVQSSDGHGLLLRYVSSYVTKAHDAFQSGALYTPHISPYQAAYRHLKEMAPLEPEMWLSLSSRKFAWTPQRLKKIAVPLPNTVERNKLIQTYWTRPQSLSNLSLLQWLREVDTSKSPPATYRKGHTLVGTKTCSPFKDDYFFQDLLLNVPHRSLAKFNHPDFERLPDNLKYFAVAEQHRALLWSDPHAIKKRFEMEGHRSWYVTTLLYHIQSLKDFYHLWKKQVIIIGPKPICQSQDFPLDPKQQMVLTWLNHMFRKRDEYYDSIDCINDTESDNDDNNILDDDYTPPTTRSNNNNISELTDDAIDWRKFIMVVGSAGTGKSYAVTKAIDMAVSLNRTTLVATPTGYLATDYKDKFGDDITADTIHAAFQYPVSVHLRPTCNWNIANYDLVIIDELSMVPKKIFHHVASTISEVAIRPVVILAGDERQLQPLETVDNRIRTTESIMHSNEIKPLTMKLTLTCQHRTDDGPYNDFLEHIRYWRPSQRLLDEIQKDRILFQNDPTDQQLLSALLANPTSTVVTVSHSAANRINKVIIDNIFDQNMYLAHVNCDSALGRIPLYKGMRVMITQNLNKQLSVVNGRLAEVTQMQGETVFLKLKNKSIVQIYPTSTKQDDSTVKTVVPLMPAYGLTIPKAQGQTLLKCIVWLDSPVISPGGGYVALSRCRQLENILFMTAIKSSQVTPVRL